MIKWPEPACKAAIRTLEHLGYTYHGAEYWKPPLGNRLNSQSKQSLQEIKMSGLLRHSFENGKYIVEGTKVLRYNEPWRDITGDKFIGCMLSRIEELQEKIERLENINGLTKKETGDSMSVRGLSKKKSALRSQL